MSNPSTSQPYSQLPFDKEDDNNTNEEDNGKDTGKEELGSNKGEESGSKDENEIYYRSAVEERG